MRIHVVVPALVARDPDVATLLRQRHEELADTCADALPPDWTWVQPQRRGGLLYSVAQFSEASLRESVLATGRRMKGGDPVCCRLDMMCVAVFRRTLSRDGQLDYAAVGALGDEVAHQLGPDIATVCNAVADALKHVLPADDSTSLSPGIALWSHRVAEIPGLAIAPIGGMPALVLPGLWIADGQTTVDPTLVDIEQVLIALELATVHWLTIDSLNRKLFARLSQLYDDASGQTETLEGVYLQAVEAAGTVTAVEMLLEDQRLCLPTVARSVYDGYAEQWNLAGLRAGLARRANDIVDHDARRVDYLHAKQAEITSNILLVLTLATIVPAMLAVVDFVTGADPLGLHEAGRVGVFAGVTVLVAIVIVVLRRLRPRLPRPSRRTDVTEPAFRGS